MFRFCASDFKFCEISLLVLFFFSCTSISQSQEFTQLTDKYYCGRFSDGKLHVVTINSKGFTLIKKGRALKFVATQIASADQRLDRVGELRQELKVEGANGPLTSKIGKLLKVENLFFDDVGDKNEVLRVALDNLKNKLQARRKLLNTWRKAVKDCENNKFPGIENVYAKVTPYYAQGWPDSRVGFLLQIPQLSKKQKFFDACLVFKGAASSDPLLSQAVYSKLYGFVPGPFCLGNGLKPADASGCTGRDASTPGLLTGFFPIIYHNTGSVLGPDPSSDLILGQLAWIASLDWDFKVVPIDAAPGGDCKNLASK